MPDRLDENEIARVLLDHPMWTHDKDRGALHRRLRFATFGEALAMMVRVGIEADKADHHPEWTNVYDTLDIWLTTHDAGGISQRDVAMVAVIDRIIEPAITAQASVP